MPDTDGFDCAAAGQALVTLAVISKLLGHASIACTARDYVLPHEMERTPEQLFVLNLVVNGADAVMSDEQALFMAESVALPELNVP